MGTKGVEQAKDLGSAKSFGKNSDELVMIAPENLTQELNDKYVATLENLRTMIPVKDIPQESNKKKTIWLTMHLLEPLRCWYGCSLMLF